MTELYYLYRWDLALALLTEDFVYHYLCRYFFLFHPATSLLRRST